MTITLSSNDSRELQGIFSVLSSPLEASSGAEWREDVLTRMARLFDADGGSFVVPSGDSTISLLGRPMDYLTDYLKYQSLDVTMDIWKRIGAPPGFSTEMLSNGDRRVYTGTGIYEAAYRPHRIEDALALVFGLAEAPTQVGPEHHAFAPGGNAITGMFCMYADAPGRSRFDGAGVELITMLQPLFRAAAQTWIDLSTRRREMIGAIDSLSDALCLYDASNRLVHINSAMRALTRTDESAAVLNTAAAQLASRFSTLGRSQSSDAIMSAHDAFADSVDTGTHRYSLTATAAGQICALPGAVLVRIERRTFALPHRDELRRRFAFTEREAEVALLLVRGDTNKRMAAILRVTEFTARRHTENVLRKLKTDSRSKVSLMLLRPESTTQDEVG